MGNRKHGRTRTVRNISMDAKLYLLVSELSEKTSVPISRLVDEGLRYVLSKEQSEPDKLVKTT